MTLSLCSTHKSLWTSKKQSGNVLKVYGTFLKTHHYPTLNKEEKMFYFLLTLLLVRY